MTTFRTRLMGKGLYLLSQITRKTARYHVSGRHYFEQSEADERPTLWVAWHGMTMMLAGWVLQNYNPGSLVIMMPDDWRGEALGHWAGRIGATPWQMNLKGDRSMATARRLVAMLRLLQQGRDAYITPDGPDGPAYEIKPGVAYLAQKSGAILLPVGAYTRHGHRLNRWDRYVVPYPYSRIAVVIGAPIAVPGDVDLTAVTEPLTDVLHRVTARAAANYYEAAT